VLAVAEGHPLADRDRIPLSELRGERIALVDAATAPATTAPWRSSAGQRASSPAPSRTRAARWHGRRRSALERRLASPRAAPRSRRRGVSGSSTSRLNGASRCSC
jgi:hypothetical protein